MENCKGLDKQQCKQPNCIWVDKTRKFCRNAKNIKTLVSKKCSLEKINDMVMLQGPDIQFIIDDLKKINGKYDSIKEEWCFSIQDYDSIIELLNHYQFKITIKKTKKKKNLKIMNPDEIKTKKKKNLKIIEPSKKSSVNENIINQLTILRDNELINKVFYKVKAYNIAINAIKNDFKDTIITNGNLLKDYKGIGSKIIDKINEIIKTGDLIEAKTIKKENKYHDFIIELSNIHGIGGVKAVELVEKYHIHNIKDLIDRQDEMIDKKRTLLNNVQKKGLLYYEDCQKRIPRKEMNLHQKYLQKINTQINKIYPNTQITIVGSYRRQKKESGDIDVLITNKDNNINVYQYLLELLEKEDYIKSSFSKGIKKFMGMCLIKNHTIHRRLDILYTTYQEFPFALLYFTGSSNFNTTMREYANNLGYRLNEYSLHHYDLENKKIGDVVDYNFTQEKDIFTFFNLPFIEPKYREKSILEKAISSNTV